MAQAGERALVQQGFHSIGEHYNALIFWDGAESGLEIRTSRTVGRHTGWFGFIGCHDRIERRTADCER